MARRGRRALAKLAALGLVTLGVACHAPRTSPSPAASASPHDVASVTRASSSPALASAPLPASPVVLPPLAEPTAHIALAVPGFREAVVSVPLGATSRRPLALALHGNFDRPEWQCEVWRRITQGEVFVLCPRGIPRTDVPKELDRWEWGSVAKTKAEIVAAVAALRARFPSHVQPGPLVFTGFSLGAILGARLIQDPDLDVGAAVLVEGGYQGWTLAKARAMKPRLGRLLFACGQTECRNAYRYQLERLFEAAEVSSSMVSDIKAGHTYDDPVAALIQPEWAGLVAALKTE
jgi:dienelactone hydrolase